MILSEQDKMPQRSAIATEELARLLSVLAHRHRIRIVEELRHGERGVSELQDAVDISPSRLSQHLGALKGQHLLRVRREGRRLYYRLADPAVATWLAEGLSFVECELDDTETIHEAVEHTKHMWLDEES